MDYAVALTCAWWVLAIIAAAAAGYGARYLYLKMRFSVHNANTVVAADGQAYRVHAAADSAEAAHTLAEINHRLTAVMRAVRAEYRGAIGPRGEATRRLLASYDPSVLVENSPKDPSGDTSYVIDKGARMALCLRDKDPRSGRLHDINVLTFVALHELAHVAAPDDPLAADPEHPPVFWATFKWLLAEAEALGYHSPRFAERPQVYCGKKVEYNPLHDPSQASI